jgi:maltose alpha-D-glucosyltransferase/alpha-amylase
MHWWKSAKIYELYIDKFAGDLPGLITRLEYLKDLGVNTLHLLPHYPSPMIDDGYDITDYRAVREELGTLEDFKRLIEEAHLRGIRIITDFVLNHTSNRHPWFIEASSSKNNPKRDFYLWRDIDYGFEGSTNMFPDVKPSNWIHNPATEDYYFATFYPQQPDLNWDSPEVFDTMVSTMEYWAEMGVDGFRLDAAPFLIKRENSSSRGLPETHQTIKNIRARLEKNYPEVILLAEAAQTVALTKTYFGDGDECHMAYHFPLMEQMWMSLVFDEPERVANMCDTSFDIPENCQWGTFLRNHDEISLATLPPQERRDLVAKMDPNQKFVLEKLGFTSMRVGEVFQDEPEKILSAFKMLYRAPGAPIMYYGDEIGMRNLSVEEGIVDTRRYVRGAFDWGEESLQEKDANSILNQTKDIIAKGSKTRQKSKATGKPAGRKKASEEALEA